MNLGNLFEEREIQEKLMVFDKCNLTFKQGIISCMQEELL